MAKKYKISATPYFKLSLQKLSDFLSRKYSAQYAAENKKTLRAKIKAVLPHQPGIAPVSERLLDLGIREFHQWAIDDHNIVFYRIAEQEQTVHLLLAMDSRQDIQKLLYELMILN